MSVIFNKLNLKNQTEILVINAPESFEPELATLENVTILRNPQDLKEITFSLAFVTRQKEVDTIAKNIAKKVKGDAVIWFAYPKGTSKKYKCDFNRDTGWGLSEPQASKASEWWRLTKTGPPCDSDEWNSYKR